MPDGRKNWYPCQEPNIPFFCLAHSEERAEHERAKEIDGLSDLTQGKETYSIPAEMGLAFRKKFCSVLAAPGTANGKGHGGAPTAADIEQASVAQQWQMLLPELPLPRGLLTKSRSIDFTFVADTVDRQVGAQS